MQWYYALNGQRVGPVSPQDFAQAVADGTVTGETLVWHEGIPAWVPWQTISATTTLPAVGAEGAGSDLPPALGAPEATSAGAGAAAEAWTRAEFVRRLRENGFAFSLGEGIGRIWKTMTDGYWLGLGVVVVVALLTIVAGMLPVIGLLANILVAPQLTAGAMWFFLQRTRGESPAFESVFDGFRLRFVPLLLLGLIQFAASFLIVGLMILIMLPFGLSLDALQDNEAMAAMMSGGLVLTLMGFGFVISIVAARFMLAHVIVMDQPAMNVIDALLLSWRITGMRFWSLLAICVLVIVVTFIGFLPFIVGWIFLLPLVPAAVARVYEDARLSAAGTPAE